MLTTVYYEIFKDHFHCLSSWGSNSSKFVPLKPNKKHSKTVFHKKHKHVNQKKNAVKIIFLFLTLGVQFPNFIQMVGKNPSFTYQFTFVALLVGINGLYLILPIVLGYFLSNTPGLLMVQIKPPRRTVGILLIGIILFVNVILTSVKHWSKVDVLIFHIFYFCLVLIVNVVSVLVVNTVTDNYITMLVSEERSQELIMSAEKSLSMFRALKKGLSPYIFILYSLETLLLIMESFQV